MTYALVSLAADLGPGGDASGSSLADWTALWVLLGAFAVIVALLLTFGRAPAHATHPVDRALLRVPGALERLTGVPGWAAATIGTGLFGLLVAGQGFYSDVAWHIALGRDDELFTAPHTAIVVGLALIALSAMVGILLATLGRLDVGLRWGGLRIPWSTLPLGALGLAAVSGFAIDEVWHAEYGVDVTMWSPPHMIMILGATFTGLACWLVLAEAKVPPRGTAWRRGIHVVTAWLTLQGLAASQGEFAFGVPQFQQMFHPVLVTLAAGFAIVAARLVLGRGWALGVVVGSFVLMHLGLLDFGGESGGPVPTRDGGLYLVSAVVVELVALLAGTRDRLRFAVLAGLGVGTIGLAGEFAYNADWALSGGAYQPWTTNLLPDAAVFGVVAGVAAAVLGTAFAATVNREGAGRGMPAWAMVMAGVAAFTVVALPMPRPVGDVVADMSLEPVGPDEVHVQVVLDPPDAADEARWFQAVNWQGGELRIVEMERAGPGEYRSAEPVWVSGRGKTLVRLHRGGEMMAVPVRLPEDPEIGEPEIPAVDRTAAFVSEQRFLLREQEEGRAWISWGVHTLFFVIMAVWVSAFVVAARRISPPGTREVVSSSPDPRPVG
jgi:hypothetical protein